MMYHHHADERMAAAAESRSPAGEGRWREMFLPNKPILGKQSQFRGPADGRAPGGSGCYNELGAAAIRPAHCQRQTMHANDRIAVVDLARMRHLTSLFVGRKTVGEVLAEMLPGYRGGPCQHSKPRCVGRGQRVPATAAPRRPGRCGNAGGVGARGPSGMTERR